MVSFNIILWNDTIVLDSGLVQEIGGISLLQESVTDVLFITWDFVDGARPPFCFSGAGKNTISFKSLYDFIHRVAFKLLYVNALYDFSLLRVDGKISVFIFGVSKKMIVVCHKQKHQNHYYSEWHGQVP